ncbi:hypothetical protein MBRA1_000331 [Malassezia brasiliensis]|uniref:Uncharacterized protein n=1 Tax=Malassezia brasiliensis TaxID=1821822 RepID=A0AAF0DPR3_9BASI|nr:hypothetical protein MBRA1_000331 [Malassezia brasiliensis]
MSNSAPNSGWLKACNILSYLFFTSSNLYAGLGGDSIRLGKPVQTYLTPAQWLFGVWSLINFLFLGLLVYQFTPRGGKAVTEQLGWRFPALFVLNSLYTTLFSLQGSRLLNFLAFLVLCLVAGMVSYLYGSLRTGSEPENWMDRYLVHLPFSLYHGFIVVVFFVAAFTVFGTDANTHKAGVVTKILVFITLFFLESTAAGYVFYGNGDIAGASVISLGLLAIFDEQRSSKFIHWSALCVILLMYSIFFVISFIAVLRAVAVAYQAQRSAIPLRSSDEEAAPLIH